MKKNNWTDVMRSRTIDTDAISATEASMSVSSQNVHESLIANSAISNSVRKPPASASWTPEPLLDSEEAAAIIKVHPKTLQKLARQGRIPGVHVGKLWRFRASVIEACIAQADGQLKSARPLPQAALSLK